MHTFAYTRMWWHVKFAPWNLNQRQPSVHAKYFPVTCLMQIYTYIYVCMYAYWYRHIHIPNLLHGIQIGGQPSVHAKDFLVDNSGYWQAIETVCECLPDFHVVPILRVCACVYVCACVCAGMSKDFLVGNSSYGQTHNYECLPNFHVVPNIKLNTRACTQTHTQANMLDT